MNAGPQIDRRIVAQLLTRASRVERAALAIEVHAAAEERRVDAKRHAYELAEGTRRPDRPHRQMKPRRLHSKIGGNQADELFEGRVLGTGEEVRAAGSAGTCPHNAKPRTRSSM